MTISLVKGLVSGAGGWGKKQALVFLCLLITRGQCATGHEPFSSPESVVSWSRGRTMRTGRLQIKPSVSGDENGHEQNSLIEKAWY